MKIVQVVGTRPQFVKAAAVCRAIRQRHGLSDYFVHTGQHSDPEMSETFFRELELPRPARELGISGGSHAQMIAQMFVALETVLREEKPDLVLLYGDGNTTLAAGLAAAKFGTAVAHIEAGLRSFNRAMPEEINRVLVDHIAELHFAPTPIAVENLRAEGIGRAVHLVGDVMCDVLLRAQERHQSPALGVEPRMYYLLTIHRAANTDDPQRLAAILRAAAKLEHPVIFPVHPRTRKAIEAASLRMEGAVRMVAPMGYFDFIALQANARAIVTDSGGVQKEAYMLGVPCVTVRAETEWPETVDSGWNRLVDVDETAIAQAVCRVMPDVHPQLYGDGHAADRIVDICEAW